MSDLNPIVSDDEFTYNWSRNNSRFKAGEEFIVSHEFSTVPAGMKLPYKMKPDDQLTYKHCIMGPLGMIRVFDYAGMTLNLESALCSCVLFLPQWYVEKLLQAKKAKAQAEGELIDLEGKRTGTERVS